MKPNNHFQKCSKAIIALHTPTIQFFKLLIAIMLFPTPSSNAQVNSQPNVCVTGFVKNAGQVYDYDKNPVPSVLYSLNANNSSIFITNKGLTYSLIERDMSSLTSRFDNLKNVMPENKCLDKKVARLDMEFIGASILKENITGQLYASDVQLSYYGTGLAGDAVNMKYCKQLLIKNIYPQVDWILKITGSTLKYDFIVHPGADANVIRIKYKGAAALQLNTAKDEITATTALGKITEGKLYCYTMNDKKRVDAVYNLVNDTLKISTSSYDKKQTLVIDPAIDMVLTWSTFYGGGSIGGGGGTVCSAIKSDEKNNRVYVVGYCFSNPFPNYNNTVAYYFSPSQAGSTIEAFISAFNLAGKQKWATYYMSTEYDAAFDVATDKSGNVYMTGTTESNNLSTIGFFTLKYGNGFIQSKNNVATTVYGVSYYQEGFIVKFNKAGQLKWATLFGGNLTDQLYGITCDYNNNVYITGLTWSTDSLPMKKKGTNGFFQTSSKLGQTGIIAGFNSKTDLIWSTCFGSVALGGGSDCRTITCDAHNNIYVTGAVGQSTGFPFKNSPGAYYNPGDGFYLSKFDNTSKQKYCSSFQPNQRINDVSINKTDGSILIAGCTDSGSYFTWTNASNKSIKTYFDDTYNGGNYDGFLIMMNPHFSIQWSTLFGGNGDDLITAASLSDNGQIFITGYNDNSYNASAGTFPVMNAGGNSYFQDNTYAYNPAQIFISSFESKSGADPFQLLWSTLFGDQNSGIETANDLDVNGKNIFITGSTFLEPQIPGFPLVSEPNGFLQTPANPLVNGFNAIASNGLILKFANEKDTPLRAGNAISLIKDLKLYPNPCSDKFIFLKINSGEITDAQIQVTDVFGRTVITKKILLNEGDNDLQFAINSLTPGTYILKVTSDDGSRNDSKKFVKE